MNSFGLWGLSSINISEVWFCFGFWRLLGTPTEQQWPGVMALRDWHVYPKWEPQDLSRAVPSLSPEGIDLLTVMLFSKI